jgi:hypothetical protein
MTGDRRDPSASWKRYPHVPSWGDPRWFTFPACDGDARRLGVQTYFVDGFLRGAATGKQYAFMTVFTDARVMNRTVRFSFFSLALYDCERGHYGTFTEYDPPRPPGEERREKLAAAPDHLRLRWDGSAGESRWENARDPRGALEPFAWRLELRGVDHHGARMELGLAIDASRPPAPLGGPDLGGEMMFLGEERTFSYFQSGLDMRGRVRWGDLEEDVSGTVGWIDRQWAEDDFAKHQDPESTRYRNEWRVIHLDNGWDMSCFHQYRRDQRNAVVPWTGMSAQGPPPDFELRGTHRVELEIPEFVRSPGIIKCFSMLSDGPRWFPRRYRLRVPAWDLDLAAEPFVEAPAHQFPIEWWTGPVRIGGSMGGKPVAGLGFDERSSPRVRGFEMAEALRLTADHAFAPDDRRGERIAYRAWEVEALALRGDPAAASTHLRRAVAPLIEELPGDLRAALAPLATDLLAVLEAEAKPA